MAIGPFGDVFPCVQYRRGAGNVRERPLSEIWGGSPVMADLRGLSGKAEIYYCPGTSLLETGNPEGRSRFTTRVLAESIPKPTRV